jgi:hypothetical protein
MKKPPPAEIRIVIRFSRRPGWQGYDVSSVATTTKGGKVETLGSRTDRTYAIDPFPSDGISVVVWPLDETS